MAIQAFKLGAVAQDSLNGVRSGFATFASDNFEKYYTVRSQSGTAFQVSTGSTTHFTQIVYMNGSATGGLSFEIGYGDTAVAEGTGTPTNWTVLTSRFGQNANAEEPVEFKLIIRIPSAKYPCIHQYTGLTRVTLFGIEV